MSESAYTARFQAEAWINNEAVPVDPRGETEWDCTKFLSANNGHLSNEIFGDEGEPEIEAIDKNDRLIRDYAAPPWIRRWDGPYTIYVTRRPTSRGIDGLQS